MKLKVGNRCWSSELNAKEPDMSNNDIWYVTHVDLRKALRQPSFWISASILAASGLLLVVATLIQFWG